ncbi:MAG: putative zinc-binding protein [Planctomycetota bacterium]|jgi:uncharacterized metal-binding protein
MGNGSDNSNHSQYETVNIEKTKKVCTCCEDYAQQHASKPVAIMCCEGACLRGEIARQAANFICYQLAPEKTARICLGGAFTKDTGQRNLVRKAPQVVALEGCFIECSSRMMKGAIPDLNPEIIVTDKLCDFDKNLFGIDQMPEEKIKSCAQQVAEKVIAKL